VVFGAEGIGKVGGGMMRGGGGGGGGSLLFEEIVWVELYCTYFNINLSPPTSALSKQLRANPSWQSPTLSLLVPATPIYDTLPTPTPKLSQLPPQKTPSAPHTHNTHTHTYILTSLPTPPLCEIMPHLPNEPRLLALLVEALAAGLGDGVRGVAFLGCQAGEFAGGGGGLGWGSGG